jgi:hypothetical protein
MLFARTLLGSALAVAFTPALFPQEGTIRVATFHKVKAGEAGNYVSAAKELAALRKKAGSTLYHSRWQSMSGESEFVMVRYYKTYSELDNFATEEPAMKAHAAEYTAAVARLMAATASMRRVIEVVNPELSLPMPDGAPPAMVSVLRVLVKPERLDDYMKVMKEELVPGMKKAGAKVFVISRARFGAPGNEITSVRGMDNFAVLDGPSALVEAMGGREAYSAFLSKLAPMRISSEYQLYRFRPEMSHLPPATAAPSGRE